jgi:hypothetical protein
MISQELIVQARQSDLAAYLLNRGEPLKRVGKNYTHKQHDSLYIKDNMFVWYSQGKQGNSVDFLMLYYRMDFKPAIEELTHTQLPLHQEQPQKCPQERQKAADERRVIAYLCKRRGLDTALIYTLIAQKKLYQDTNGNCVFVICDWEEKPNGAEIVGTGDTRFKQITTHSGYGYHLVIGKPTEALYFESAIDMLSCYQMYRPKLTHHILVSMGGLNSSVIAELRKQRTGLNHWLCVDNDAAGNKFISEMCSGVADLRTFRPPTPFKDWNECLLLNEKRRG